MHSGLDPDKSEGSSQHVFSCAMAINVLFYAMTHLSEHLRSVATSATVQLRNCSPDTPRVRATRTQAITEDCSGRSGRARAAHLKFVVNSSRAAQDANGLLSELLFVPAVDRTCQQHTVPGQLYLHARLLQPSDGPLHHLMKMVISIDAD